MEHTNIFYTAERSAWRQWMEAHFSSEKEIWFVFPTKASGEASLSYNDAVEEALCFGWIDSTAGKLDDTHGLRRFTPRREGSPYSRPNIERLLWLEEQGMIHPSVRPSVLPFLTAPYIFPEDILDVLRKEQQTWTNFCAFSEPYKRIRIAYIDDARHRPSEFQKRLENFCKKTAENKLIVGYGGIEKYYK